MTHQPERCTNCQAPLHVFDRGECRNCGYNGTCRTCGEPTTFTPDLLFCSRECEKEAFAGWEADAW